MAYADLTTEQKAELQDWLQFLRPTIGEFARLLSHLDIAKISHTATIAAILALLANPDVIPNESGLAGATSLTKADLTAILATANTVLTDYKTTANLEAWIKFCGATNMIG